MISHHTKRHQPQEETATNTNLVEKQTNYGHSTLTSHSMSREPNVAYPLYLEKC